MTRFVPSRAGIVNLWDYRDEEFAFAGGWLILRGPNGSGKTKALEVLFPFVLDGRIDPKRLNPFASEDRTMKSNLLFRGQDSALGYVWMEFRDPGTDKSVTVGIGLHAQRHRDTPVRWHFVCEGRVGADFSLLTPDDRPMTRKQLLAELGEQALIGSASDYRAAIDRRLFGLGRERYEQLITLILTLRRPQLAKNLDPAKLSDTLTDGLRPIDDELITEAARSFDDMESVQRTLEGLVAADEATAAFLSSYRTYLRTHARWAADALTRRREEVAAAAEARLRATEKLAAAERDRAQAEARTSTAEDALAGLRARLEQLKASAAYEALQQLADLERLVRTCADNAGHARGELDRRTAARTRAAAELETARRNLAELEAAVSRTAGELADEAQAAGIAWSAGDAGEDGFTGRIGARVAARTDDVRAVRAALTALARAEQARDLGRATLERAQAALAQAEEAEAEAAAEVVRTRSAAHAELSAWADRHTIAPATATALAEALDQVGEPDARTLEAVFGELTAPTVQDLRDEQARLRETRRQTEQERQSVQEERQRIAAEHDDAPAPHPARTRPQEGRAGAPLWRLVRFRDRVGEQEAAGIEAALEAAGLLDAWVTPEPEPVRVGDSDAYLFEGDPASGATLLDVLEPDEDIPVPSNRVAGILRAVELQDDDYNVDDGRQFGVFSAEPIVEDPPRHPVITPGGRFFQGVQLGAHRKAHAEYIGATARARRRAARLAECDARLAALDDTLADLDRQDTAAEAKLEAVAAAGSALPRTGPIVTALRAREQAAGRLRGAREGADEAQRGFDEALAAHGAAERALRRTGAERGLAPDAIDEVAGAVQRFERAAGTLAGRRREATRQLSSVATAADRLTEAADDEASAAETEQAARRRHTEEAAKLEALQATVGAEAREVLAEVERTERHITGAVQETQAARTAEKDALTAEASAGTRVETSAEALAVARREERQTARELAPYARRELLDVLKCPPGLAWPAQEADWQAEELPAGVREVHEAVLAVTRDLTPTEISLKQSTTRLTKALEDLQAQLTAADQDYRPEWDGADGVIVVRVTDEEGPLPVGAFAAKISAGRNDQQQLLSDSEQRILEDALLTRLAQQIHDRTVDARDLIRRMNTEMRSRRMSSGTTVGVGWLLADHLDDEQRAVCGLLDGDAARLRPDDLARMRGHFAAQIKNARARHRDRPYRELLADVLDYRRWRQFAFQLVRPGGAEERLTRSKHSRLSGGEQSVSLHLPLFAAAHAMLNSARPDAPRLLALDEAFAGVDDTGRGELMSLAAQFDLDLFMTGYDLWATHASVSAAAHYDLAHSPVDHTVSPLLLVWDGAQLLADDTGDLTAALGSPGTRKVVQDAEDSPLALS
ncbi:TIGR02680 family protein [Nonomuraea sp. K274]|uniref:TIGR02680 family protein n=1 Tax=Nonomuraea cypriaca TaxID=1187855 RepID=A0A931AL40_9ACTN|nr:TIGR02680 family protein [Nonomuraea cypriaca]MBF8192924.1 TIGR02680 family protein [Nonomuraea cypriaca]